MNEPRALEGHRGGDGVGAIEPAACRRVTESRLGSPAESGKARGAKRKCPHARVLMLSATHGTYLTANQVGLTRHPALQEKHLLLIIWPLLAQKLIKLLCSTALTPMS